MQVAMTMPRFEQVTVNIPRIELKRFKAIMKALDYEIVRKSELDEAIEEAESGRIINCSSLDELKFAVN